MTRRPYRDELAEEAMTEYGLGCSRDYAAGRPHHGVTFRDYLADFRRLAALPKAWEQLELWPWLA